MKKLVLVVVGAAALYAAVVYASWQTIDTPLYTYRMEQQSNKMGFLPTKMNNVTYAAEKGYTLNYEVATWHNVQPKNTMTICVSCQTCYEPTCVTCFETCLPTCDNSTGLNTCGESVCVCPTGPWCP
jgi:hypothetical protein